MPTQAEEAALCDNCARLSCSLCMIPPFMVALFRVRLLTVLALTFYGLSVHNAADANRCCLAIGACADQLPALPLSPAFRTVLAASLLEQQQRIVAGCCCVAQQTAPRSTPACSAVSQRSVRGVGRDLQVAAAVARQQRRQQRLRLPACKPANLGLALGYAERG
jgi:hypothetical protein